jgi:hypothetical protein
MVEEEIRDRDIGCIGFRPSKPGEDVAIVRLDVPARFGEGCSRLSADGWLAIDEYGAYTMWLSSQALRDAKKERTIPGADLYDRPGHHRRRTHGARHELRMAHQDVDPLEVAPRTNGLWLVGGQTVENFGLDVSSQFDASVRRRSGVLLRRTRRF